MKLFKFEYTIDTGQKAVANVEGVGIDDAFTNFYSWFTAEFPNNRIWSVTISEIAGTFVQAASE